MNALHLRQQQTVADPLQSERWLKALKMILEPQENQEASRMLCPSLDQASTTRRHHREPTAYAHATHSAPRLVAATRA
jgi:hypothetical protein